MWVRKRIDIRWSDLAVGLYHCLIPSDRQRASQKLESLWSSNDDALTCLSVRSGFDLLLQSLELPEDSEIIMTSVTIPDMPRIVKEHSLKTVPVDLEMKRMAPDLEQLRAAINDRTKAIVVAHLFGGKVDLKPIAEIARQHNLLLIEDCAQAYVGTHETGHEMADVSMHSFGPIKTNTALCGALFRIRRPEILDKMRERQQSWPTQSRSTFARRILKYAFVQIISLRVVAGSVAGTLRLFGKDHDGIATTMARGFAGANFFDRIRKQPSTPLIQLLERRLRRFDTRIIEARVSRGDLLNQMFQGAIPSPGAMALTPTFWVYPIVVDEPEKLVRMLWTHGFDATWHSSLTIVEPDPASSHPTATEAERVLKQTVYLPFSRRMSEKTLRRMGELVLAENPKTHFQIEPSPPKMLRPSQRPSKHPIAQEAS